MRTRASSRATRKQTIPTTSDSMPDPFSCLFLGLLRLDLLLRALFPHTDQSRVRSRLPQLGEGAAVRLGHVALLDLGDGGGNGRQGDGGGDGRGRVLRDGGLLALLGEDHDAAAVRLEALDVDGKGLLRVVDAAVVDSDSNGRSHETGDAGGLIKITYQPAHPKYACPVVHACRQPPALGSAVVSR